MPDNTLDNQSAMDSATDFGPFQERVQSRLVQTTRTVGQLASEDLNFHRSSNPEFSKSLDEQNARILSMTSSVLQAATARTDGLKTPVLRDEESIEDNWRGVVDVIDALLEKADASLDEFTGVIKRLSPSQQEQAQQAQTQGQGTLGKKAAQTKFPSAYDYGPSKIPKPQLQFERLADNTDVSPFRPLLRAKPHAIVPLEKSLVQNPQGGFAHPYETEIRAAKYPPFTYVASPPVPYLPFESTAATFVDTMDGVKEMLKELKFAREIAVDLEHHDVHSYHGLVSLMQISTRDKDWVVDTLKPWREELQILNEVFADPAILKVLHGSYMDIIWLQRDLGLYIVGLFDTFHAADILNYPKRSLKFLLERFVNFEADKRYQMADWRVRPLPPGMFDYARADTHYLLYVYDHLRNQLVKDSTPEENYVEYVIEQSKKMALQRYERSSYDAETGQGQGGWYDALVRSGSVLSKEQFSVFRAVHQWRDEVARAEDEGVQCVFPKHVLFKIAHFLPLDMGTLLRTLSPMTPIARSRASDLLEVIKKAKLAGATGPELRDVIKPWKPLAARIASEAEAETEKPGDADHPVAGRCGESQFWGNILESREPVIPPEFSVVASHEALRLSLPLPPMPMTVSEAREKLGENSKPAPPPPQPAVPVEAPEEPDTNEIFTVRESRKRKPSTPAPQEELDSPTIEIGNPSAEVIEAKRARKKAKKEKKALLKSQDPNNTGRMEEKKEEETAPFDYTKAESMLYAPTPRPLGTVGGEAQPKRPFNPYEKALDTSTGARRMKRDTGGKAFTFMK